MRLKTFLVRLILALGLSALALATFAIFAVFAQTTDEATSTGSPAIENTEVVIAPEELDVGQPILLPTNPIYPLKTFWRRIRLRLTRDPVRKNELLLRFSNQALIEAQTVKERGNTGSAFDKALDEFRRYDSDFSEGLSRAEKNLDKNPARRERFAEKLLKARIHHLEAFSSWEKKLPTKKERLKAIAEKTETQLGKELDELHPDQERLASKLAEISDERRDRPFRAFNILEILDRAESRAPEKARVRLKATQERLAEHFSQRLEKLSDDQKEKFSDFIEKLDENPGRQIDILERLKNKARNQAKAREVLERVYNKALERTEQRLEESPKEARLFLEGLTPARVQARMAAAREAVTKLEAFLGQSELTPRLTEFGRQQLALAKRHLTGAEELLARDQLGQAFGQAVVTERIARSALRHLTEPENKEATENQEPPEEVNEPDNGRGPTRPPVTGNDRRQTEPGSSIVCTLEYNPVCGEDNRTYSNACHARRAGAAIRHRGVCEPNLPGKKKEEPFSNLRQKLDQRVRLDERLEKSRLEQKIELRERKAE